MGRAVAIGVPISGAACALLVLPGCSSGSCLPAALRDDTPPTDRRARSRDDLKFRDRSYRAGIPALAATAESIRRFAGQRGGIDVAIDSPTAGLLREPDPERQAEVRRRL